MSSRTVEQSSRTEKQHPSLLVRPRLLPAPRAPPALLAVAARARGGTLLGRQHPVPVRVPARLAGVDFEPVLPARGRALHGVELAAVVRHADVAVLALLDGVAHAVDRD